MPQRPGRPSAKSAAIATLLDVVENPHLLDTPEHQLDAELVDQPGRSMTAGEIMRAPFGPRTPREGERAGDDDELLPLDAATAEIKAAAAMKTAGKSQDRWMEHARRAAVKLGITKSVKVGSFKKLVLRAKKKAGN